MRFVVFAGCYLIFTAFAQDEDPQLAVYRGRGQMLITGTDVQCTKSSKKIPITKVRDGTCDCDKPSKICRDPSCSDCDDPSDEICPESTFFCGPGKCVAVSLFSDGILDCTWNCIEPDVKDQCITLRRSFINEIQSMAVGAMSNPDLSKLRGKCTVTTMIYGMPLDCIAEQQLSDDCQFIKKFLDWCQEQLN